MGVCYRALQFPFDPIQSISEIGAIQGGVGQMQLLIIGIFSWCVVLIGLFGNSLFSSKFKAFGFGEVLEMIGCYGVLLIGLFELDAFNSYLLILHYIGSFFGLFSVIAFNYQQFYVYLCKADENNASGADINIVCRILLPILLDILLIAGFTSWMYFVVKAREYAKDLKEYLFKNDKIKSINIFLDDTKFNDDQDNLIDFRDELNKWSLRNVFCESLVVICAAYSMCLYLIFYDEFLDYA